MLAVLCRCVKYSGEGCQECTHKNARGPRREREREGGRMAEMVEPAAARLAVSGSGCFTLGTEPDVMRFHGEAFP